MLRWILFGLGFVSFTVLVAVVARLAKVRSQPPALNSSGEFSFAFLLFGGVIVALALFPALGLTITGVLITFCCLLTRSPGGFLFRYSLLRFFFAMIVLSLTVGWTIYAFSPAVRETLQFDP